MKALVDTSVWSLALRKNGPADHPCVKKLEALLTGNEDVVLTGVILQEVLQAFRAESTFHKIVEYFEPFPLLEFRREDFIAAARLHRTCAAEGISISTVDCQIAIASVEYDFPLLTADKDFQRIAGCSTLKLI